MGLGALLDNTDNSSKYTVFYDKQLHWITPKLTSNATRSKPSYLYFTTVTESQISLHLTLWQAVFVLQAILRIKFTKWLPNDFEH